MRPPEPDPYEGQPFDEAFIGGASFREPSASEREREAARWIALEAARQRAVEDEEARWQAAARRRRRRPRALLLVVAVAVLVAAVGPRLPLGESRAGRPPWRPGADVVTSRASLVDRPTPTAASSDEPLATPAASTLAAGGGDHSFLLTQPGSGEPAAFDPCRPIAVVVNAAMAPPEAAGLVDEALADVGRVAGVVFEVEGPTSEEAGAERPAVVDRYGDRWAPVLVAWADDRSVPDLAGPVAGVGGPAAVSEVGGDRLHLVSGQVVLDAEAFTEILERADGRELAGGIVRHELGHLLGLGHVDDPDQLMYGAASEVSTFQPGDLAGLARLAEQPCAPLL